MSQAHTNKYQTRLFQNREYQQRADKSEQNNPVPLCELCFLQDSNWCLSELKVLGSIQ